jgi:hypothetical protein
MKPWITHVLQIVIFGWGSDVKLIVKKRCDSHVVTIPERVLALDSLSAVPCVIDALPSGV